MRSFLRSLAFRTSGLVLLAALVAAQSLKLNRPLERGNGADGGRGVDARVSPGGERVVYDAALDSEARGLFSVRSDGSERPRRLVPEGMTYTGFEVSANWVVVHDGHDLFLVPLDASQAPKPILPPAPQRTIDALRISPDEQRIVYRASAEGQPHALYSVALKGARTPLRISGAPAAGSVLPWFEISPDSRRAVFTSNQSAPAHVELYSTPLDGSAPPVKLNGPMVGGVAWSSPAVQISPDGTRVVYLADQDRAQVFELYSAPLDGRSPAQKLNRALDARADVWSFSLSPDGRRAVYLASLASPNGQRELYSSPVDASAPAVRLNGPLDADGSVYYADYAIAPDSRHVAYWFQPSATAPLELALASIDEESEANTVGAALPGCRFSPDGQSVVYRAGEYGSLDLYSVPVAGGTSVALTASSGPHPWFSEFVIPPDGNSVVFVEDFGLRQELQRVPLAGSGAEVTLGSVPGTSALAVSPDGKQIFFRADATVRDVEEIFSVPVDGRRAPVRLNDPVVTDIVVGDVVSFALNPRGGPAVFEVRAPGGYEAYEDHVELFSVLPAPQPRVQRLTARAYGAIGGYEIDPTGRHAVFQARHDDYEYELWSARLDGSRAPVLLLPPSDEGGAFRLTPDGERVLYSAEENGHAELAALPIEGGPETELSGELEPGTHVDSFEPTSDGARVIYVTRHSGGFVQTTALFGVPLDGSSGPARLDGALDSRGDTEFRLSPDARVVVYLASPERDAVRRLYAVPADGSAAPRRLSGSFVRDGDVLAGFQISPDGRTVVYRADAETDEVIELYAVPLDGSAAPVKLSGALVTGGDVQGDFVIAPDGARVVYRADAEVNERFDLYGAPIDGSAGPRRLDGELVAGGDVLGAHVPGVAALGISPDGTRVVYRADARVDEEVELFSVLLDGSARALALAGPLPAGGDVLESFAFTPDGEVLYVADARVDDRFELWASPLDRVKAARVLNGSLVPGGDAAVQPPPTTSLRAMFAVARDGRSVIYMADQDTDEVIELYMSYLGRGPVPAGPGLR
jgi:Tol biopolymer transport system component